MICKHNDDDDGTCIGKGDKFKNALKQNVKSILVAASVTLKDCTNSERVVNLFCGKQQSYYYK